MYYDFIQFGTKYKIIINIKILVYQLGLNNVWDQKK